MKSVRRNSQMSRYVQSWGKRGVEQIKVPL